MAQNCNYWIPSLEKINQMGWKTFYIEIKSDWLSICFTLILKLFVRLLKDTPTNFGVPKFTSEL